MYTLENILNRYNDKEKEQMKELINNTLIPLQSKITKIRTPYFQGKTRTDKYEESDTFLHRLASNMHNVALRGDFSKTKEIADSYVVYANRFINEEFGISTSDKKKTATSGDKINLYQLMGYANGSQITKSLNMVSSSYVSFKPYDSLSKDDAINIIEAIKEVNKKAHLVKL